MAEQEMNTQAPVSKPKSNMMKIILLVVGVVLIETATVFGVMWIMQQDEPAQSDPTLVDQAALAEEPVELLLLSEKFQNSRSGIAYMFDTEIYAIVKRRDLELIESRLDAMRAQISRDINTVFRRAEPSHLSEGELSTLTRQIKSVLDAQFGVNEETGEPYIREALIRKCIRYRADM